MVVTRPADSESPAQRVLAAVRAGAERASAVEEATGLPRATVVQALYSLRRSGQVRRQGELPPRATGEGHTCDVYRWRAAS